MSFKEKMRTKLTNYRYRIATTAIAFVAIITLSWETGILHDNVTFVSHMSSTLIQNPFAWGSIPIQYDPGHPPFTASYLAFIWRFVGRSLATSHLALYPFVLLALAMLMRLISFFIGQLKLNEQQIDLYASIGFALCALDPTFSASLTLIGPEVFLLSFALTSLVGMLEKRNIVFVIGLCLLGITSMRGMMICVGICLTDIISTLNKTKGWKSIYHRLFCYLLGALPALAFVLWRLLDKGWITSNPVAFQMTVWPEGGFKGFISNFVHNSIVFVRWLLDFGRFVPIAIVLWLSIKHRKELKTDPHFKELAMLCCIPTSVVIITSLLIHNTMGHRYFTLTYLLIVLTAVYLLLTYSKRLRTTPLVLIAMAAIGGDFLIYPDAISQGWDASLAHIHYWNIRKEALEYMKKENITPEEVCKYGFGNCNDDSDLGGDTRPYQITNDCRYAMCSNIDNLADEDITLLNKEYVRIKRFKEMGVWIDLLERKESSGQ